MVIPFDGVFDRIYSVHGVHARAMPFRQVCVGILRINDYAYIGVRSGISLFLVSDPIVPIHTIVVTRFYLLLSLVWFGLVI